MTAHRRGGILGAPSSTPDATSLPGIDEAVDSVAARARDWAVLPADGRRALLEQTGRDLGRVAEEWVSASLNAKGMPRGTMAEAEELLFLATVRRAVRVLGSSMRDLAEQRRPRLGGPARRLPGGQLALRVFPTTALDRLVYRGMRGEVWSEPGCSEGELLAGGVRAGSGEVAAVLGAGNASMLPAVDVLHQLVVEGRVVVLKPNPVNAYLGPLIERAFGGFVRAGFLRVVYGGAHEGDYLCRHPTVDAVHLTGSHATFRALVGGLDPGDGRPPLGKPVTSELGNVSPVIVVPGPWSEREVERQAARLTTWLVAGGGFGCLTPRVLIQQGDWPLRGALLGALRRMLNRVETRPAYYPGAAARFAMFTDAHPEAWLLGDAGAERLPWALIPDVDASAVDDICFRQEAFCGLLAETPLPSASVEAFIDDAVTFANTVLWGTLNATLLVHPATAATPAFAQAVDDAVGRLRYGTVTINSAAFAAYHLQVLPWGAFPADACAEAESGQGKVANGLRLRHAEKSVLRGPFADWPDPLNVTARRPDAFARRLGAYAAAPSVTTLPGLATTALRSSLATARGRR